MTTGPQDPSRADRDRLRVGHADRERAIETLKDAFAHGRLTRNEFDARAGLALTARTYADLAALTADLPSDLPLATIAAKPAGSPARARRRRPLVRGAAGSASCLVITAVGARVGIIVDPGATPTPYHAWAYPIFLLTLFSIFAAAGFLVYGVAASLAEWHSRRQLPPPPGQDGHAVSAGDRRGSASPSAAVPSGHDDRDRADLRAHKRRRHSQSPVRAGQPRSVRSAPGAA